MVSLGVALLVTATMALRKETCCDEEGHARHIQMGAIAAIPQAQVVTVIPMGRIGGAGGVAAVHIIDDVTPAPVGKDGLVLAIP